MKLYQCFYCEEKLDDEQIEDSLEDTFYICETCYTNHTEEWENTKKEYEQ